MPDRGRGSGRWRGSRPSSRPRGRVIRTAKASSGSSLSSRSTPIGTRTDHSAGGHLDPARDPYDVAADPPAARHRAEAYRGGAARRLGQLDRRERALALGGIGHRHRHLWRREARPPPLVEGGEAEAAPARAPAPLPAPPRSRWGSGGPRRAGARRCRPAPADRGSGPRSRPRSPTPSRGDRRPTGPESARRRGCPCARPRRGRRTAAASGRSGASRPAAARARSRAAMR